jgi:hypothetical protein
MYIYSIFIDENNKLDFSQLKELTAKNESF